MKNFLWIVAALFVLSAIFGDVDDTSVTRSSAREVTSLQPAVKRTDTPSEPSRPAVAPDTGTYFFVTGDRVNQRTDPSTRNNPIGQLNRGARVRVVRSEGGWTEIVSSLGQGWMSSRYLSRSAPAALQPAPQPPRRQLAVPSSSDIQRARTAIIRQSIASYPGPCACPFNVDRAGRRCGKRSAWSRPGGYSPICYDSDVSQARIDSWLARQR